MIDYTANKHINYLNSIISSYAPNEFEGNCIYQHQSVFDIDKTKQSLRNNLYELAKYNNNIIEIGINGGHSCSIFFEANPKAKILGFDLCAHGYTKKCCEYLSSVFDFTLVQGDSAQTVSEYVSDIKYDLVHIDGGHSTENLINDIRNCKHLSHADSILVIDDIPATQVKLGIDILQNNKEIKDITNILLNSSKYKLLDTHYHKFYRYS